MRGIAIRAALAGVLTLGVCSAPSAARRAGAAEVQGEPVPGPERVVDTGELMDLFLLPAYQDLQRATTKPPESRQDWAAIYKASVRFPALAARARRATVEVVNATLAGLANARPDDYEAVRRAYVAVSASCNACHRGLSTMNGATIKP